MERLPFEEWAPAEIARLRSEADGLAQALSRYLSAVENTPKTAQGASKRLAYTNDAPEISEVKSGGKTSTRKSKYDYLISTFFERSGKLGLTMEAMIVIANELHVNISRAQLRSLIFAQKSHGRVHNHNDLYIWREYSQVDNDIEINDAVDQDDMVFKSRVGEGLSSVPAEDFE